MSREVRLAKATDDLNAVYHELELYLTPFGVCASVEIGDGDIVEFRKVGNDWGLHKVTGASSQRRYERITDTPRAYRIRAAKYMHELVAAVKNRADEELLEVLRAYDSVRAAVTYATKRE